MCTNQKKDYFNKYWQFITSPIGGVMDSSSFKFVIKFERAYNIFSEIRKLDSQNMIKIVIQQVVRIRI